MADKPSLPKSSPGSYPPHYYKPVNMDSDNPAPTKIIVAPAVQNHVLNLKTKSSSATVRQTTRNMGSMAESSEEEYISVEEFKRALPGNYAKFKQLIRQGKLSARADETKLYQAFNEWTTSLMNTLEAFIVEEDSPPKRRAVVGEASAVGQSGAPQCNGLEVIHSFGSVIATEDRDKMEGRKIPDDLLKITIHAWVREVNSMIIDLPDSAVARLTAAEFMKDFMDDETCTTIDLVNGCDSAWRKISQGGRPGVGEILTLPALSATNGNCQGIFGCLAQDESGDWYLLVKKSKNMYRSHIKDGYYTGTILDKVKTRHGFVIARYNDKTLLQIAEQVHRSLLGAWSSDILRGAFFNKEESDIDRLFTELWLFTLRVCHRHGFWGPAIGPREWEGVSSSLPFYAMSDPRCWFTTKLPDELEYDDEDYEVMEVDSKIEKGWVDAVPDGEMEERCNSPLE